MCAFCTRLNQRCTWDGEDDESPDLFAESRGATAFATASNNGALAARVALLESRLSFLDTDNTFNFFSSLSAPADATPVQLTGEMERQPLLEADMGLPNNDFLSIPNQPMFRSLIDIYFERCHNQPYAYFHEEVFRQDYESGLLPEYLLYAFAATACRFSDEDFYGDRRHEAIEAYARASFSEIFEHSFSDAEMMEVSMVIALAMLAVVEFSGKK